MYTVLCISNFLPVFNNCLSIGIKIFNVCFSTALEWMLGEVGAVRTKLEEDPRKKQKSRNGDGFSILTRDRRTIRDSDSESDDE